MGQLSLPGKKIDKIILSDNWSSVVQLIALPSQNRITTSLKTGIGFPFWYRLIYPFPGCLGKKTIKRVLLLCLR